MFMLRLIKNSISKAMYIHLFILVQDLSRNGTFVNGEVVGVKERRQLKSGDVISFCDKSATMFSAVF